MIQTELHQPDCMIMQAELASRLAEARQAGTPTAARLGDLPNAAAAAPSTPGQDHQRNTRSSPAGSARCWPCDGPQEADRVCTLTIPT